MSSDEDIIPDSPPNPHKLNVVMFRTIKRKVQQTIEVDSYSSTDDSKHLNQEGKKESTEQKRRVHKLKSQVPEEKKNLKRRLFPKDESKTFIVDSYSSADDSEHLIQERKKESTHKKRRVHNLKLPVSDEKKNLKRRFLPKDGSRTIIVDSYSSADDSEHLIQEGKKESTQQKRREHKLKSAVPEEKKNLKRRLLPKDKSKTFIEEKRRRVAEWVKQVATGQKGLNFPGEVKQTKQRTARSATVTKSAEKKGKKTIRYRPHVKCKICNTHQKNIWRHMRLMHDSGKDIKKETKVMSKSGYVIRICPIKDCSMIVERMKDHLVRTHKIKRHTQKLERLMKKAEPLTEIKKSQNTTSDIIEISSDDECHKVKPIKKELKERDSGSNYESDENNSKKDTSDECLIVKPIKKETIELESDSNDYDKCIEQDEDSINSLGFQQTDMDDMDSDSNMSNKKRNSTGQTDSVHSLGFVYESPGYVIEVSDREEEKNTENSPTKRYKEDKNTENSPTKLYDEKKNTENSPTKRYDEKMTTENSLTNRYINMIKHKKNIYSRSQQSQVLKDFANYLVSAPNLKTRQVANQHQHQVCELWLYITPNMTIKDLCTIYKLNEWTGKKLETLAPGTIRSYLSSMGLFVDFLMETGLAKHVERFQRFRESCKTISKKLKRRAKMRRTVVETEEIETMILPVDIQMFLGSETAKTIEKKFDNKSMQVVPSTFYDVRDYMLLRLLQTNAQRPMAVRNITINSIDRAKRTDDGGLSITVAQHKTQEGGPVVIQVNPKIYIFLKQYIQMLKTIPGYPIINGQSIFTTWPKKNGTVSLLTSSQVNKGIQRIWDQGPVNKTLTATRLRKATATAVRTQIPASREILARHMTHNPETADRHYALYNQRELAVPVTNMISAVMEGNQGQLTNIKNTMSSDNQAVHDIMQGKGGDLGNISKSIHWPKDINDNDSTCTVVYDVPSDIKQLSEKKSENMNKSEKCREECKVIQKKSHGRRSFEAGESSELLDLCNDLILKGNIKKAEVMERVTGNTRGRIIMLNLKSRVGSKDVWKIITDRLQTERKRRCRKQRASW